MKIGFSTFVCPDWSLESILTAAVRYGYHGVEFRCDAGHGHGIEPSLNPDARREIETRLTDSGIEPCCLATGLQFASDWAVEESKSRLELAAELGCPAIRVLCGKVPEDMPMPFVIEKVGQHLRDAAEFAMHIGVKIWIETHDTLSRGSDAAAAVRMAGHPSIGLVYDNLHPFRRGEPLDLTIAAISELVDYVHFHDGLNQPDQVVIKPFGHGELPIVAMMRALERLGFDRYVCGEWFHHMYGRDPDKALKAYYQDIRTLALQEGLRIG